jgi:HdeA/HdeB family
MISKLAPLVLTAALLAACAPAPPPAPAPAPAPPPPAPAPAPEPPVSTAPIPIRTLSCAELLGASDDDRAAASMFFIGYQAARSGVHNLSISDISTIEQKALTACAASPNLPAVRAFAQAVPAHAARRK